MFFGWRFRDPLIHVAFFAACVFRFPLGTENAAIEKLQLNICGSN